MENYRESDPPASEAIPVEVIASLAAELLADRAREIERLQHRVATLEGLLRALLIPTPSTIH